MMANLLNKSISARWVFNCRLWNPTEADWLRVSSGIQEDEKIRIGKFVFKRDAKASAAGRLLIRKYIVDSTGLDWNSVFISRDDNGKPVFQNDNFPLSFNVAHQGDFAVLAGEPNVGMVGVDIMKVEYSGGKSVAEFFRIMNRQFSQHEWDAISLGKTELERLALFYRFWCLKESYVKAIGVGITISLKEVSFKLNSLRLSNDKFTDDTELYLKGIKQSDWTFQEILVDSNHCVAVAMNVARDEYKRWPEMNESFQFMSFGELTKNLKPITVPDVIYCREFLTKEEMPS